MDEATLITLSRYLDGDLTAAESQVLEARLEEDDELRLRLEGLKQTRLVVRNQADGEIAPPELDRLVVPLVRGRPPRVTARPWAKWLATAAAVVLAGWYLGTAVANLTLALAPQRVILGGGVMKLPGLFAAVRDRYREALGGYFQSPEAHDPPSFIVPPGLGDRAGVLGAIALAEAALQDSS